MLDFSKIKTFDHFIEEIGTKYENHNAFIWRPKFRAYKLSYGDLYKLSKSFASYLEKNGIGKGDRVVLWVANSPWWVAAFFGCHLKGAIVVPLAPQNSPEFVNKIADITQAKLIVKNQIRSSLENGIKEVNVEEFFKDIENKDLTYKKEKLEPNDLAEILYTSGTTGEPKGVELRHSNILSNVEGILSLKIVSSSDSMLSFLPLSHIFEQVGGLFVPLSLGAQVTQAAYVSGLHIQMNMQEDQPTKMTSVPEFLRLIIKRIEEKAEQEGKLKKLQKLYKLSPYLPMSIKRLLSRKILKKFGGRLNAIVAGGAALDPEVGRKWEAFGVYILQGYGASETSPVVAVNKYEGRKLDSVGPLLPGVEVKFADDKEILVKGPNVVSGYYKNPEKTAKVFKDGWYYTDDIGFLDEDGHLHIQGRKKYLIVTPAGENVYPEDIESKLSEQPDILDSTVIGLKVGERFEIHAVLLPKPGVEIEPEKILEEVNKKLEHHQKVQGYSIWPEEDFPRTVTRKVKKGIVQKWLKEREHKTESEGEVRAGPVEQILARITGFNDISITPEKRLVTDLKMDSLARVTLVSAIEEDLNVVLDESEINTETTVAEIKRRVLHKKQKEEHYPFMKWPLNWFVSLLRNILQLIFIYPAILISSNFKIKGKENLKKVQGEAVFFYPNHISGIDPVFILCGLPYRWRSKVAIAAATDFIFEGDLIGKYAKLLMLIGNSYPFSRKGQIKSSLVYTSRLLDRGYSIILFPEGEISEDGKMLPFKGGTGMIPIMMNAPVIPMIIKGTDILSPRRVHKVLWWKHPKITLTIGEPMRFSEKDSYIEATKKIEEMMHKLNK